MIGVAHTADLSPATLAAVRALLDTAFDGDFSDDDWDHSLGGMHALAWSGEVLIGHAAVVQRRFVYEDRALRVGYVEGVAVHPDHRRQGIGATVMEPVERIIRGAYHLGALSSSEMGLRFYEARGWQRWQGPTATLSPTGPQSTDDDVHVLPVIEVALTRPLTCDWRDGDVW